LRCGRWGRERYGYDNVAAHRPGDIHRHIAHLPAIRQYLVADDNRCEGPRHRHAGPHGHGQVAIAQHDHIAGDHVGGHGAKGNWQRVEIAGIPRTGHEGSEQVVDALGVKEATGAYEPSIPDAQIEAVGVWTALQFLANRHPVAIPLGADGFSPVDGQHLRLDHLRWHTGGKCGADQRTHTGSRHTVNGNAQLLQYLQHAYVGSALGAPAAEYQADPRPRADLVIAGTSRGGVCQQERNANHAKQRSKRVFHRSGRLVDV